MAKKLESLDWWLDPVPVEGCPGLFITADFDWSKIKAPENATSDEVFGEMLDEGFLVDESGEKFKHSPLDKMPTLKKRAVWQSVLLTLLKGGMVYEGGKPETPTSAPPTDG